MNRRRLDQLYMSMLIIGIICIAVGFWLFHTCSLPWLKYPGGTVLALGGMLFGGVLAAWADATVIKNKRNASLLVLIVGGLLFVLWAAFGPVLVESFQQFFDVYLVAGVSSLSAGFGVVLADSLRRHP